MNNENKLVSVIVPVYNSARTIEELVERINAVFQNTVYRCQLIMVDDGSKDHSWEKIETLSKQYANLIGIKLAKNFGQHSALLCGIRQGDGELYITLDDDLQYPPEEMVKLLDQFEKTGANVVYGIPQKSNSKSIKDIGSYVIAQTSPYHEKNNKKGSSFRLLDGSLATQIKQIEHYNFIYLDVLINWHTTNKTTVNVYYTERKKGKSGYTLLKLIKLYSNILFFNYSSFSLVVTTYVGFGISFISFIVGLYYIYLKLNYNVPIGYTSIIVTLLFSTGILLLFLSIMLQFLLKIFLLQTKKPLYFIEKKIETNENL